MDIEKLRALKDQTADKLEALDLQKQNGELTFDAHYKEKRKVEDELIKKLSPYYKALKADYRAGKINRSGFIKGADYLGSITSELNIVEGGGFWVRATGVIDSLTEKQQENIEKKYKAQHSLEKRYHAIVKRDGVPTSRDIPFIYAGTIMQHQGVEVEEIHPEHLNYKTYWAIDIITSKACEEWTEPLIKKGKLENIIKPIEGIQDLFKLAEEIKEGENPLRIFITDQEIRQFLEKPHLSKSYIRSFMTSPAHITFSGKALVFPHLVKFTDDREDWSFDFIELHGGFCQIWVAGEHERFYKHRSKRKLRGKFGKEKEENVYIVDFIGEWGMNFIYSALLGRVFFIPKRLYNLSGNAQLLYRIISTGRNVELKLNLIQLSKLWGWDNKSIKKNFSAYSSRVKNVLEELKGNGFINISQRADKGSNLKPIERYYWKIVRRRHVFTKELAEKAN